MDITILAAWGEFLGGIAVIASLIYLASQIRQSAKMARATAALMVADQWSTEAQMLAQDEEVARIYYSGLQDRDILARSDRQRFDACMHMEFGNNASRYQLMREGVMNRETWKQTERAMRWVVTQPGARQWWSAWSQNFGPDFQALVENLVREGDSGGRESR